MSWLSWRSLMEGGSEQKVVEEYDVVRVTNAIMAKGFTLDVVNHSTTAPCVVHQIDVNVGVLLVLVLYLA